MTEKNGREGDPISRRALLTKGLRTAAALGLGAVAFNATGHLNPFAVRAMDKLSAGDLNFAGDDMCVLTCQTTEGPCYYNGNLVRRDITEGITGMPVRLAYRVVNVDTCTPIQNASVEIWHADRNGNYSAPISAMCTNDTTTRNQTFGRGIQFTDSGGWAYFDSIYPGWYSGRVTHIHARVRLDATTIVTSQFFFWDKVSETIYRNHPLYTHRPNRDTTNTTDNIIGGNLSRSIPYIMNTKLVNNRFLQAVKTIGVRTTATVCNA
ncbi:MAG: hypothetical protein R2747_18415 [Pyrinomonadaceae bacterium]